MSAKDKIAQGPTPAADSKQPKLIGGLPADYVVPGSPASNVTETLPKGFVGPPAAGQVRAVDIERGQLPVGAPRYFEGDELAPAAMSAEDIARLQSQLVDAGLLAGTFRVGVFDERTRGAYKNLLEYANTIGADQSTALARYAAAPSSDDLLGTGKKRAPLTIRKPNRDELGQVFRDSARRLGAGRAISDAEVNKFVDAYTNMDVADQTAQYNQAETGGTTMEPPSPDVFAEQQVKATHPVETEANGMLDAYNRFLGIIGGQ